MASTSRRTIERAILELVKQRPGKTICPSEVARALAPEDFRPLMPAIREAAGALKARGVLQVTQRGQAVDPLGARGAIRLSLAQEAPELPRSQRASEYHGVDFRAHPELYRVGRGEQGVLSAEPYKSELLPLWRFKTPAIARQSSRALWRAFVAYRKLGDFVGMDMARKFLQMGFTRARRYANHASGSKYAASGQERAREPDELKAEAAAIFREQWQRAEADAKYQAWRAEQRRRH